MNEINVDFRNNEDEFELIGLNALFDTSDDSKIDWEEFFNLRTVKSSDEEIKEDHTGR